MPNPADPILLSPDDRTAARAFLQRTEVRLSTVHRVASALLSGAGIMVLLPTVERDTVVQIARNTLTGERDPAHFLLALAVVVSVVLPVAALWVLLIALTRFYFHADQVDSAAGADTLFVPRYTLTSLRLPDDELGPDGSRQLDELRRAPDYVRLLVPDNDRARARIDVQHTMLRGPVAPGSLTDLDRAALLLESAAARDRSLLAEVAKVEYGLARHVLRVQVLVLRYTKALLALITTATAAFVAAGAIAGHSTPQPTDGYWIGGVFALWAPAVIFAVTSPVHWLTRVLKHDQASDALVRNDREMTHFEDVAVRLALLGWCAAAVAVVLLALDGTGTVGDRWMAGAAVVVSAVALVFALVRWDGTRVWRRVLARHR